MSNKEQKITATTTTGACVEISLEDWASTLIEKALAQHKAECPVYSMNDTQKTESVSLDKRICTLELKLKILQWATAPLYLGAVTWLVHFVTTAFEAKVITP